MTHNMNVTFVFERGTTIYFCVLLSSFPLRLGFVHILKCTFWTFFGGGGLILLNASFTVLGLNLRKQQL